MSLLECIPNISEGRRPEVFDGLVTRATAYPGIGLLDASSDRDHNRSVLTLAGEPEALHGFLLSLYEYALAEIDMRQHDGVHPCIGAVDVTPFVPLGTTPMATAVAAAGRLGASVAERFELPVFLYEEAARHPRRAALPAIRRGGLSGLAERLSEPAWRPDFGPARLHPRGGATVIGARFFLIAVNTILESADVELARQIAHTVRESSGGLPAVRALGLSLDERGAAQVSMNLVDYRRTSLATALAAVRREAAARGTGVAATEIIGLVPERALVEAAGELVPGPEAFADRSLEAHLREAGLAPG